MKALLHFHFPQITSTNDWAKSHLDQCPISALTLISADFQTAGRGQHSRDWIAPPKENILATFVFFVPEESLDIAALVQLLALSAVKVLKTKGFLPVIKWPNDLMLNGKKVAGILCETMATSPHVAVLMGIGLNVNMSEQSLKTVGQPATSLLVESGHPWEIEALLKELQEQFAKDLEGKNEFR